MSQDFCPCIIIPSYNHGYATKDVVRSISSFNIQTIIVDDGSSDDNAVILQELATSFPWLHVIHRRENGGKGAAVRDGLVWALQHGFSHAVLIDGDGQHDAKDIPKFIEIAKASQGSLILGVPKFGPDVPWIRYFGREISNGFAVIATWGFLVRDILCGFRVYPLQRISRAVLLEQMQPRMGFDVEIIIRLIWAGFPVVNVPTQVCYPAQGVSHFRYVRDNLQLVGLYTALICQGLFRGPLRLIRAQVKKIGSAKEWHSIGERGSLQGLRILLVIFDVIGRRFLPVILGPVVLYMFLRGRTARRSAISFQKHMMELAGEPRAQFRAYWQALCQFWEFGVAIVDKIASWREESPLDRFSWSGHADVETHLAAGRGVILMGAHVGNIEVMRALGDTKRVVVNALMFTANSKHFKTFLEEVNRNSYLNVIDISEINAALILELQDRIARGEVVALLGDRLPKNSSNRSIMVPFLGREAAFPEGPWILASMLEAPVYSIFNMRESDGSYRAIFRELAKQVVLPRIGRREAIYNYVKCFAEILTEVIQQYPYQWFNFYDFWALQQEKKEGAQKRGLTVGHSGAQ